MGETIGIACPDGSTCQGYLAEAAGARRGIVVLQEWWGLNDQIKGVAKRFAAAGITALAPDLYDGRVTQEPDEANHLMTGLDWVGACQVEVRGALAHLKATLPRTAVTGFCLGGALTAIAAAKLEDCDAAVCYYGLPPEEQTDPAEIRVPFQGHFADEDDWCTPADVDRFEARLAASGGPREIHRYRAKHAFFNEAVDAYDAEAAELSWQRTLAFLDAHL